MAANIPAVGAMRSTGQAVIAYTVYCQVLKGAVYMDIARSVGRTLGVGTG